MQVVATRPGFYAGARRRIGAVFDMAESAMKKKDGKIVLPSWVTVVTDASEVKEMMNKAKRAEMERQRSGVIAASGGKAAKDKVDTTAEQLAG